jgi:hypothetical protein
MPLGVSDDGLFGDRVYALLDRSDGKVATAMWSIVNITQIWRWALVEPCCRTRSIGSIRTRQRSGDGSLSFRRPGFAATRGGDRRHGFTSMSQRFSERLPMPDVEPG